ncbi:MAG: pantoate--beta-alanine ligase [Paracoccaceae bacterium]
MILRTAQNMRQIVLGWKAAGLSVGVVPTMGALHEGHLSLIAAAKGDNDRVIVTIFVNPTQFNNPADLASYPRREEADADLLVKHGVDVIFAPLIDQVYPHGFASKVTVLGVSEPLEGIFRPGYFSGVATVVAKIFSIILPDRAYFGEKDWQQVQVISRMSVDLNLPVQIVTCPTLRAPDGMALSSRNTRLSPAARETAAKLYPLMQDCAQAIAQGQALGPRLLATQSALVAAGFDQIDYFTLCDGPSLERLIAYAPNARLLAAVWLGDVRLIDNIVA